MSMLDVGKCKNSYIASILDKKKCVDDLKTQLTFSIFFLLTLVRLTSEKETAIVNHSPSFYLRVNNAQSIYVSVTSHEIWT